MKVLSSLFLISALLMPMASSPAKADGLDVYWQMGDRGNRHHRRPPGRDFDRDIRYWHGGQWMHGPHEGREGWWWRTGDAWYLYPQPVYPYPDIYTAPIYVAQPQPTYVMQPTTTIVQPAPTTTYISQAQQPTAAPQGTEIHFKAAEAPKSIEAEPASSTYIDPQGRTCRDFKTTVQVSGKSQSATGKACQGQDGAWRAVQ